MKLGIQVQGVRTVESEAARIRALAHAMGADPFGVRTLAGATNAYVRGAIEIEEFERRVEAILRGRA